VQFSPSALFEAIEANVIEPIRSVQKLLDGLPYVTRLYSTLSAADMTLDPVFTWNPELGDVSNVHSAERIIECNPNVSMASANWRIELPQGGVIRGRPEDVGSWPSALNTQPPNLRVLQLGTTGAGAVLADNRGVIEGQLSQYNDSVMSGVPMPGPDGSGGGAPVPGLGGSGGGTVTRAPSGDDGCSVTLPTSTPRSLGWGSFGLVLGLIGLRSYRRARPRA
jgi:hypothetical protein